MKVRVLAHYAKLLTGQERIAELASPISKTPETETKKKKKKNNLFCRVFEKT